MPINLKELARNNNWILASYSEVKKYGKLDDSIIANNLGITIFINNRYLILFDDKIPTSVKRFTIAHEIGHIVLNHKNNLINEKIRETQASMFAARLLMPMCVLYECKVCCPKDIQNLCGVSFTSATYRFNRLELLKQRNKFYTDNLEVIVSNLFKPFINQYNKNDN